MTIPEMHELIESFKNNREVNNEMYKLLSEALFIVYEHLLNAGFNERQAMEIICERGTNLS